MNASIAVQMSVTDLETLPGLLRSRDERLELEPILTYGDKQEIADEIHEESRATGTPGIALCSGIDFF
jgi:hypothetical protein